MPPESDDQFAGAIRDIAILMAEASGGRLRLATGEADTTDDRDHTAGEFLKLDGKRLGRDLEVYGLMGAIFPGDLGRPTSLIEIAADIMTPIRREIPASFDAGAPALATLGRDEITDAEQLATWNGYFGDLATAPTPR